jgi:BrnA antitoxin of type II toxin-antitoxin system
VIPLPPEKVRITVRLDRDIVNHFREQVQKVHRGRGNYQTLINDAPGITRRPCLAQRKSVLPSAKNSEK